ncbi:MAG: rhomboid family intramembrane serine protease [Spirochaetes bacterium]|nr:rhomboid family intramembrane serine protease [Spirochaetota bacterium]
MRDIAKFFKFVYMRFIIVGILFILFYSLISYVFVIRNEYFKIDYDYLRFYLPLVFSFIVLLLFFRPRLRLLNFENKKTNVLYSFVYLFAAFALTFPTLMIQDYFETALGKMTKVEHVDQIITVPETGYYTIENLLLDKSKLCSESDYFVAGDGKDNLNFRCYICCPILNPEKESENLIFSVWYGIEYSERIDNDLSESEKDIKWDKFIDDCFDDFENKNPNEVKYLKRISYSKEFDFFEKAIHEYEFNKSIKEIIVLTPVFESFESRKIPGLSSILGSFLIFAFIVFFISVWIPFHQERYNRFIQGKPDRNDELNKFLTFMIPRQDYFFTPILIIINLLIFLIMVFSGLGFISFEAQSLLDWGADYKPLVLQGQYWRLLTNIFIHGGLMHVLMNCYGLFFAGVFLEPAIGKWRFLVSYLITGIIASTGSIMWHKESIISVGASGAIFGIFGVFLALLTTNYYNKGIKLFFMINAGIFTGYNLIMGLAGGIDNAAHVSGLLSGLIAGYILYFTLRGKKHEFS